MCHIENPNIRWYAKIDFAYQRDNLSLSKLIKKEGRPAARNVSENGTKKSQIDKGGWLSRESVDDIGRQRHGHQRWQRIKKFPSSSSFVRSFFSPQQQFRKQFLGFGFYQARTRERISLFTIQLQFTYMCKGREGGGVWEPPSIIIIIITIWRAINCTSIKFLESVRTEKTEELKSKVPSLWEPGPRGTYQIFFRIFLKS